MVIVIMASALICNIRSVKATGEGDELLKRDRYLVLDSRIIETTDNLVLTVGFAHKDENNPLFGEDKPWEVDMNNAYPHVMYDEEEGVFKCWYNPFIASPITWLSGYFLITSSYQTMAARKSLLL